MTESSSRHGGHIRRLIACLAMLLSAFVATPSQPVQAHGGGLDGDGGHNCRVGSCAGTYHCHRYYGGRCTRTSPATTTTTPRRSTSSGTSSSTSSSASSTATTSTRSVRPAACVNPTAGLSQSEIARLQTALKDIDAYRYEIDGKYGAGTSAAVARAAASFSLVITDPGEPSTQLLEALGVSCSSATVPEIRDVEGSPAESARCVDAADGLDEAETTLLQWALSSRSFDVGPVDGILGARTIRALQGFELSRDLPEPRSSNDAIQDRTLALLAIGCSLPTQLATTTTAAATTTTTIRPKPTTTTTEPAITKPEPNPDTSDSSSSPIAAVFGLGVLLVAGIWFVGRRS